jgi:hypothetical protein
LITGGPGWSQLSIVDAIKEHDQVIMMGHGYPGGLFGINFKRPTVINWSSEIVDALKSKTNSIFIWCNADGYVRPLQLKGFFTGMFVSEVGEALYCGLGKTEQSIVDESNNTFANILGKILQNTQDPKEIHYQISSEYGILAETNPIAEYNHKRLYLEKELVT